MSISRDTFTVIANLLMRDMWKHSLTVTDSLPISNRSKACLLGQLSTYLDYVLDTVCCNISVAKKGHETSMNIAILYTIWRKLSYENHSLRAYSKKKVNIPGLNIYRHRKRQEFEPLHARYVCYNATGECRRAIKSPKTQSDSPSPRHSPLTFKKSGQTYIAR